MRERCTTSFSTIVNAPVGVSRPLLPLEIVEAAIATLLRYSNARCVAEIDYYRDFAGGLRLPVPNILTGLQPSGFFDERNVFSCLCACRNRGGGAGE